MSEMVWTSDYWKKKCEQQQAEISQLQAQVEVLQNRCANRGLSPEDSDALQAENERLQESAKNYAAAAMEKQQENAKLQAVVDAAKRELRDVGSGPGWVAYRILKEVEDTRIPLCPKCGVNLDLHVCDCLAAL